MTPDLGGWLIIGGVAATLLILTLREDLLRRGGR